MLTTPSFHAQGVASAHAAVASIASRERATPSVSDTTPNGIRSVEPIDLDDLRTPTLVDIDVMTIDRFVDMADDPFEFASPVGAEDDG